MRGTTTCPSSLLILLLMIFIFSTICHSQANFNSGDDVKIPRAIGELNTRIDSLLRKYEIPGVGIALVSQDSIIWIGGIGLANVETDEPVTEDTHFRVGSCTKSFLGLGFLKMIEEGRIDIDTPVEKIVPEIEIDNPWEDTHPVRVVHLLEHTSGFDDVHINSLYNKEDPEMPLKQALDAKPSTRKVRWQPGTRYSYSSPGYTLAGYILEKITGQRYEDYLKKVILEPIGMKTSTLRLNDTTKQLLSVGYDKDFEPIPYFDGYDRPASSLNSSTKEMALFVQFLLNRGKVGEEQIINKASIDRLGKPKTTIASKAGLKDGYSFGVGTHFQDGFKWLGHSGGGPGFIAKYAYLRDIGLGYVVLANRFCITEFGEICRLVQRYLIRNIDPPLPQTQQEISTEQLKQYCGYYKFCSSRQELVRFVDVLLGGTTILLENDTLCEQDFMDRKVALIPVSSNMFRKINEPEASRVFASTTGGDMVFVTIGSYYEKTGNWKPFVYRFLVFGVLIIMISAVIYALFWVPLHLYKKLTKNENRSKYLRMRVIPLLAVLSLIFGILIVTNQPLITVGQMTFNNIIFFITTLLFAGLSILGLIFSIISFKKPVRTIARIYAVVLSLACLGMTLYLSYWGIIGLKIWAY